MFKNPNIKKTLTIALVLILPISALCSSPLQTTSITKIRNPFISMDLPTKIYKDLSLPSFLIKPSETSQQEFSLARQIPLGGTTEDSGWVCNASVEKCALLPGSQNYWLNRSSNFIEIGNPTEQVHVQKKGRWKIYETFPLCGWSSNTTGFNAYGGQCYAVVLASPNKTISFQILLGENTGCKRPDHCWKQHILQLHQMFRSIR